MHLNLQEIAESLGVSEKIVQDWMVHEQLPHVMDRQRPLFPRAAVAAWAAARGLTTESGFLARETTRLEAEPTLSALLRVGGIWRNVAAGDARATLVGVVSGLPGVSLPIRQLLGQRVQSAEGLVWAPVGRGFALPHLSSRVSLGRGGGVIALVMLREPLGLEDAPPDGVPVENLLFFIPPVPRQHLDLLARLSRLIRHAAFADALAGVPDDDALFRAVAAVDVPPRGEPSEAR